MTKTFGDKAGYERHKARQLELRRKMDETAEFEKLVRRVATEFLNIVSDLIASRKRIKLRKYNDDETHVVIE